jgi:hypothetical protein
MGDDPARSMMRNSAWPTLVYRLSVKKSIIMYKIEYKRGLPRASTPAFRGMGVRMKKDLI